MDGNKEINILLVDDRSENLLALEKLLAAPGLHIMKATSGNEALALALEHEFALVLMDVQMPGMDGFETAELMRGAEETKHVPIIFVTAISKEQKHVFKGYESGAVDYLFKPLDPDILLAKVKIFLDLHRQKADLRRMNKSLRNANRKILEQQRSLIEEERLKAIFQMAGATAHELNQPLMVLVGSTEMMALDRDDPETMLVHAENIKQATERISEIVKRIQTLQRDETRPYTENVSLIHFDQEIRILSIEDTLEDFLAIEAHLMEEKAVELRHVLDLKTAFAELEKNDYDLVLVDQVLQEGTGEDFLREALEKGLEIPIVVVTGRGDEVLASRMIRAGASGYLSKGELSRSTLIREIHQALEKARLKKEVRYAQEKLAELTLRDSLTGIYNRRYFNEVLEREFNRAQRYGSSFSLCMIDLDGFEAVNEKYGQSAGDFVLKETARLLTSGFRKCDVVCRFGAEKFAAVLHRTDTREAMTACEHFRKSVEAHPMVYNDATLQKITVSIGVKTYDGVLASTPAKLIAYADQALRAAKEEGRNRVVVT